MPKPRTTRAAHDHCEALNHTLAGCPDRATRIVRGAFRGVSFICADHLVMADWGRVLWSAPDPVATITTPRRRPTRRAA